MIAVKSVNVQSLRSIVVIKVFQRGIKAKNVRVTAGARKCIYKSFHVLYAACYSRIHRYAAAAVQLKRILFPENGERIER